MARNHGRLRALSTECENQVKRTITEQHIDGILTRAGVHQAGEDGQMRSLTERVQIVVDQRDEFMDRLSNWHMPEPNPEPKTWIGGKSADVRWNPCR